MKQKIFSLLVLMISTVCGAWAQPQIQPGGLDLNPAPITPMADDTYDIVLSMQKEGPEIPEGTYVTSTIADDATITSTTGVNIAISDIQSFVLPILRSKYPEALYNISFGTITDNVCNGDATKVAGGVVTVGPFTESERLNRVYTLDIPVTVSCKSNDPEFYMSESSQADFYYEFFNSPTVIYPVLSITVYHNNHTSTSSDWEKDGTNHWHYCDNLYGQCEKEGRKYDVAAHEDNSTPVDGICDVCGAQMPVPEHEHVAGEWVIMTDGDHHYQRCTVTNCSFNSDALTSEAFTDETVINALSYGEHTYNTNGVTCDACGALNPQHQHNFAEAWTKTDTHHYHKCATEGCPLNSDNLAAVPSNVTLSSDVATAFAFGAHADTEEPIDGRCDVCGYIAHEHKAGTTWTWDANPASPDYPNYHYLPCVGEGDCDITDYSALDDADKEYFKYEEHNYGTPEGNFCIKCDYDKTAGHVHIADTKYIQIEGGVYHYTKCTVENCAYNKETLTADDFADATIAAILHFGKHADFNTYYNACEKCGYHTVHTPEEYWVTNGGNHYHPCMAVGCPLSSVYLTGEETALDAAAKTALSFGAHVDTQEPIGICDVCEKDLNAHEHFFTSDWTTTDTTHYHKCIAQGCDILQYSELVLELQSNDVKTAVAFGQHTFTGNVCSVCGYEKHIHHFSSDWTKTATAHYHKCLIQGCDITDYTQLPTTLDATQVEAIGYALHTFDQTSTTPKVCTICGYDKEAAHEHAFGDTWEETADKKNHYKLCTNADGNCPLNYNNISDFGDYEKAIISYGQHQYGVSQDGAGYYTCKVCGAVNDSRKNETHTHKYEWMTNANGATATDPAAQHWQVCVADEGACTEPQVIPDPKTHKYNDTATDETYYICELCGFIDEARKTSPNAPHAHVFSSVWTKTDDTQDAPGVHYHQCIATQGTCPLGDYTNLNAEQKTLTNYGNHVYGASQAGAKYYTCQTCGYISELRKNAAHSHVYGGDDAWKHDNLQHWKECTAADGEQLAGPCTAPKGFLGYHEYASVDDATTTDKDERALCSVCGWYNEARKQAIDNAAAAANVQSWSWDYEIPFNFDAPVQNDRRFNAEQCYTIFLPYALELNGLKAYAIEQHNTNIVGFKEQAVTELPQLTPFVVKSETTGNPLSSEMTTIYMTLIKEDNAAWMTAEEKASLISDRGYANSQASIHSTGGRLYMLGTLRYLVGNEAKGRYIMQGKDADHPNGVFKLISTAGGYDQVDNRACILPMRAHIETLGGDARQVLTVVFYDAEGSVSAIERLAVDEDGAAVIYDLQGRRVQNPRKGGLYIINGKKTILK